MTTICQQPMTTQAASSSKTVRLTAAQALVRFLANQYSEQLDGTILPLFGGIWGILGHGNVAGIGEAMHQYRDKIQLFRGQNEQSMGHAAIAYAKTHRRRRVMGVTTSIGPGATNLVTAAATAHTNRLPLLLLPGDIFASRRPDPVLQQLENFERPLANVNDCLEPVSRYFDRIYRPEQLIATLPQAIHTLTDPVNCGPVTLALPQDVQAEAFDYPFWLFEKQVHQIRRTAPQNFELHTAAQILSLAKRPLIVAGGGVHYSGACEALSAFAKKHGIPVTFTQAGKGALPWTHHWNLDAIGVTGNPAANAVAREADVVLFVGTRISDFTSASKSLFQNASFIGLNTAPFDARKMQAHPLIADAKLGLEALSRELDGYQTSPHYQRHVDEEVERWHQARDEWTVNKGEMPNDAQVIGVVNRIAEASATVVCAAGGLPGELHKMWRCTHQFGYHLEYAYSCMGYEIAGGLGAKLARPDSEVYVMVGDGSYLMMHTEILTSIQMGLKLNIVLLDNRGFGCINRLQKGCGSAPFNNLFTDGNAVDFAANAGSYGCCAAHVSSLDELAEVLEMNKKIDKTCVTVINTNPQSSTPGSCWWDVPVSEVSPREEVRNSRAGYTQQLDQL